MVQWPQAAERESGVGMGDIREHFPEGLHPEAFQGAVQLGGAGGGWITLCVPQLCCLHADMLGSLGPKEFKKAFIDFYHSFLDKHSVRDTEGAPSPTPWAATLLLPTSTLLKAA